MTCERWTLDFVTGAGHNHEGVWRTTKIPTPSRLLSYVDAPVTARRRSMRRLQDAPHSFTPRVRSSCLGIPTLPRFEQSESPLMTLDLLVAAGPGADSAVDN